MKYKVLRQESELMGKKVIRLSDWDQISEFELIEQKIPNQYNTGYIYIEIPASDLSDIHYLEQKGFRFNEFRTSSILNLSEFDTGTKGLYPWKLELIGDTELYKQAVKILESAHDDDRFSRDPEVDPGFSKKRVLKNLKKSFTSYPNEFLLGLINQQTQELAAFRSGAFLSPTEVIYYQYAVAPGHDFNHTADMMEIFTLDFLKQRGVKIVKAVTTGFNIDELNRLVKEYNFNIKNSTVILRKSY